MKEFEKIKKKLQIAEKKIRILEDMVENNTRELFLFNQKLLSKNKEKDTLLKEIHHRVKNNLQIITGLLSLQSYYIEDNQLKTIFSNSQIRINSMALVHEMLYQTENLSKINYKNYLNDLASALCSTLNKTNKVSILIDCEEIFFSIESAVPLGLLVNEILTNSFKHGFNSLNGEVYIRIKKIDASNEFRLEIGDNGIGYSEEINSKNNSLGLKLIQNLSKQLGGKILKDNNKKGTNYILNFKEVDSQIL